MTATIAFFHDHISTLVHNQELPSDQEKLLLELLIPSEYMRCRASKEKSTEDREDRQSLSDSLRSCADDEMKKLKTEEQEKLERLAKTCAEVFQRSSSCVEGRNSRLALAEHARRGLSPKKLEAMTVIHNYVIRRADGTTAAERFFNRKPNCVFDWIIQRVKSVPRPSKQRKVAAA